MNKPEWGLKRTCQACSARFYDMKKSPATCPKCGKEFDPAAVTKKRRGRPPLAEKRKAEAVAAAEAKAKIEAEAKKETSVETKVEIEVEGAVEIDNVDEELLDNEEEELSEKDVGVTIPSSKDDN